jgi:hypothetical protein
MGNFMKTFSCLISFISIIAVASAFASDRGKLISKKEENVERDAFSHAEIDPTLVASPLNRFLLVRKGNNACAVRFTKFWRDNDEKKSTVFSSGQENVYAEYESYHQGDGSFDFAKNNVKHTYGKLHDGPSYGIGRLAFKLGLSYRIQCGSFSLFWMYPARLEFIGYDGLWDKEVELAPTKWQSIQEVNFNYSKLLWSRYSDDREKRYIPLDEIP